jgi:hypothetical protein
MAKSDVSGGETSAVSTSSPVDLFDNKDLSDIQIRLGDGQRMFGHKQILAQKSDWFFRAFKGNFSVCWTQFIKPILPLLI